MEPGLAGRIVLVTGASRGAGRGIAAALGAEGATVYVTGRSVRGRPTTENWPETIDETAEMVDAAGGVGIAVRCDHTVDDDVVALFERVASEQGQLDVLVNNVWGGYEAYDAETFDAPFWEQPLWRWDRMFQAGVRAHFSSSRLAARLMRMQRHGLIVNTTFWDEGKALGNVPYDVAKTAINRMVYMMALELRPYNVAAVALSPGWIRTESVLRHYGIDETQWREVPELARTESPQYIGRAVAALAAHPDAITRSGQVLTVGDLAVEYGFTDLDGTQPPAFHIKGKDATD